MIHPSQVKLQRSVEAIRKAESEVSRLVESNALLRETVDATADVLSLCQQAEKVSRHYLEKLPVGGVVRLHIAELLSVV